jgi:hypothetical protein
MYTVKFVAVAQVGRTSTPRLRAFVAGPKPILLLAFALFSASAAADPLFYVVTGEQQFGAVDLATGTFSQIGPSTPEIQSNLVWTSSGSLLSITGSGNLESINPSTGITSVVGPTGVGSNAFDLASVGGNVFLTDFSNNLYSVNPATGAARLIGPTGIPADPAVPFTVNPDGTINLCDEGLYGIGGSLYATFDAVKVDPASLAVTPVVNPNLYRIDPVTGEATLIGPTPPNIGAIAPANGDVYAFRAIFSQPFPSAFNQALSLDLASGATAFVANIDPSAGPTFGAAPVAAPEPCSIVLAGIGIALLIAKRRRQC